MRRISLVTESDFCQIMVDHMIYALVGYPAVFSAYEQCVFIGDSIDRSDLQILIQSVNAGRIEIESPFLVALASDSQHMLAVDIGEINSHELRKPHTAVQKENKYAVVSFLELTIDRLQKLKTL